MAEQYENIIAVIPSFNEARTIGSIVKDVVGMGITVLVVDDGSEDSTHEEALNNGAIVIRNKENIGKGASIRAGIKYVFEKMRFKWLILMDGDGQHDPKNIPNLIDVAGSDDVDIVVGNRMFNTKTMPYIRYLTNKFTSWVISRICGQDIPDTQCGYRLVRVKALKDLQLESQNYDIESEILIQAAKNGFKIRSVSVHTIYGNEVSQINPFVDTLRFFGLVVRELFKKRPPGNSRHDK